MTDPPLRIAFVISYFYPLQSGAERQALAQAAELVRQGHSVHVVTRRISTLAPEEIVEGAHVHRCVTVRDQGPLFGPSFVRGVVGGLRALRWDIDLVHTHQGLWEAVATGVARRVIPRLPTLVQPASSGYYGEAEELGRSRLRSLLRPLILGNSAFAALSTDIAREWRAVGVANSKLRMTASGVDTAHFRPGPSDVARGLPAGPRVVFTGRLHPQKSVPLLLDAWRDVQRASDAQLILVGDGPLRAEVERQIAEMGLARSVHLVGAVPDVSNWLRAADVFVLPSVAEGMSNSLLEAMATGLPCIASRIGGNEDLIDHEETGLLVAPEPAAWAASLLSLLENPGFARRLGDAALARIRERYALAVVVRHNVAIYRDLIAVEAR